MLASFAALPRESITSVETRKAPPPVKVRLKRVNCDYAIPYPPDGQAREWWQRLRNAFGTASSAFVQASLYQLIAALEIDPLHRQMPPTDGVHIKLSGEKAGASIFGRAARYTR